MKIIKGQIIRLEPNNKQITYFKKACGVVRFAYNWALDEWVRQYEQDKLEKLSLSVREWECPSCQSYHDRDINASINILNKADKVLNFI